MKEIIKSVLLPLFLLLSLLSPLLMGCSESPEPLSVEKDIIVSFNIVAPKRETRGVSSDGFAIPDLEIAEFKFYLLNNSGKVLSTIPVTASEIVPDINSADNSFIVSAVIGKRELNEIITDGTDVSNIPIKILMLANWQATDCSYPDLSTNPNLTFETIARSKFSSINPDWGIPMYGLLSASIDARAITSSSDSMPLGGTLWLLRAAAKIEVKHNLIGTPIFDNGEVAKVAVSLVNAPASGLAGPSDYFDDTVSWKLAGDANPLNPDKAIHIPDERKIVASIPFAYAEDISGGSLHSIYTFETDMQSLPFFSIENSKSTRPAIRMEVTVKYPKEDKSIEEAYTYYLQFANYGNDGLPVASAAWPLLLRNTLYRFEIKGFEKFACKADVIPFFTCELEPSFGL